MPDKKEMKPFPKGTLFVSASILVLLCSQTSEAQPLTYVDANHIECNNDAGINFLHDFAEGLAWGTTIPAQYTMANDIPDFCLDAQIPAINPQLPKAKSVKDRCLLSGLGMASVVFGGAQTDRAVPWPLQICPMEETRLLGYTNNSFFYANDAEIPIKPDFSPDSPGAINKITSWGFHNLDEVQNYLVTGNSPGPKFDSYIDNVEEKYAGIKFKPDANKDVDDFHEVSYNQASSTKVRYLVCANETILHVKDCANYMKKILDEYRPHDNDTAFPLFQKIFTHEEYVEGAKNAALKIMERIKNNERPVHGNLLDDLRDGYIKAGASQKDAEDRAWDIIGAIATGGQGVAWHVMEFPDHKNFFPLKVAMTVIATGSPVLDSRSIGTTHPYSIPKEFQTSCDNGKLYHFWLTAYIARELAKSQGDATAAEDAARIAEKGYQMIANTGWGRDSTNAFTSDTFSPSNNVTRIDLAFAAAGALYGAKKGTNQKLPALNIDKGIAALIKDARALPTVNYQDANDLWKKYDGIPGYLRWHTLFSPDSATAVFDSAK